jgi:hypothetical protein
VRPTRRTILAGAAAWVAAPRVAWSAPIDRAEVDAALASFSPRAIAADFAAAVRVPRRLASDAVSLLPDGGGFAALREAAESSSFRGDLTALSARMARMPQMLGVIRRAARALPTTEDGLVAALDAVARAHLGLDLAALRAHTAGLPPGLAVIYGPATRVHELVGVMLAGPFTTWLELVHGRRARVLLPSDRYTFEHDALSLLLDPTVSAVCTVGHGTWTSLDLSGVYVDPVDALRIVSARGASSPRKLAEAAMESGVEGALQRARRRGGALEEAELAAAIERLPEARRPRKELVVRYTCGYDRYEADAGLLWELLPPEVRAGMSRRGELLSADRPSATGTWEAGLAAWLADTTIRVVERPAFGSCLVDDPSRTRGYEGEAWIDDYVRAPVPPPTAAAWPRPAVGG